MKEYWSKLAASLVPYVPGEQPKMQNLIKLNTNENPYPASPMVQEAVQNITCAELRLYPDPECTQLRQEIAKRHQVDENMVFVGNGSDEVLAVCFQAFFDPDEEIAFPDISYSFYKVYAALYRIPYRMIPLNEAFEISVEDYIAHRGGIILANPNAPTGLALSKAQIERMAKEKDRIVIIDEAYVEFGAESAVDLVSSYDNLLIVKTFSKSHSLAGMRLGYAIGNENLITALNSVKNSFNSYTLDRVAQAAGIAAIRDEAYCSEGIRKIIEDREWTTAELRKMGFTVLDSCSNFLFITHKSYPAKQLMDELRKKEIIVRYFNQPRIDNFLRVSIGTHDEMAAFLNEVKRIIG